MITDSEWQALGSDKPKFSAGPVFESLLEVVTGAAELCVVVVVLTGTAVAAAEVAVGFTTGALAGGTAVVGVTGGGVVTDVVELVLVEEDGVTVVVVDVVLAAGLVAVPVTGDVGLLTGAVAAIEGGVMIPKLHMNASNPFSTNLRAIHNSF
jgi:hypothetical protein